jgi:hypothetical protein
MKNCNFSPGLYGALRHSRYLLLAILFTLGSCRKDYISDVAVSENDAAGSIRYQSTSRSSDLESEVVRYTQWMITNMVPLVKDKAVYEDIRSGNYSTARVQSKLNALGFSGYGDFAAKHAAIGGHIVEAIKLGTLTRESFSQILSQHISDLDPTALGRSALPTTASPGTPCYDQFVSNMAFVAIEVGIAAFSGPWTAAAVGVVGVASAYVAFKLCLEENYPEN